MKVWFTISCFAGNYRKRTYRNADKPRAFARGAFGSRRQAEAHALALAKHYGQESENANVMFFALDADTAEKRYSLSV